MSSSMVTLTGPYGQAVFVNRSNWADHRDEASKIYSWATSQLKAGHPFPPFYHDVIESDSNQISIPRPPNLFQRALKHLVGLLPFSCPTHPSLKWPIECLAKTNGLVTEDEVASLRQAIRALETQIQAQTASTSLTNVPNSSLLSRQQAHLTRMRGRLSVVHNLPHEVLQEIFIWGTVSRDALAGVDHTLQSKYPWTLAHVSQHWRNVTLSTPKLWTHLPILYLRDPSRMRFGYGEKQIQHFQFVLNLTRDHLLHVAIHETQVTQALAPNAALDLLVDRCERWCSVQLDIKHTVLCYIHNKLKGRLPNLAQLQLSYQESYTNMRHCCTPRVEPWDTFLFAPKLTSIALKFWDGFNETFIFPFGQVHYFTGYFNEHIGQPPILQSALESPNMKQLRLYSARPQMFSNARLFPHLTNLHIDKVHPTILEALTAPSLEELFICGTHHNILVELSNFLRRSLIAASTFVFPLRRLTLKAIEATHVDCNWQTLISIFEYTPRLQYLEMSLPSAPVLIRLALTTPYLLLPDLERVIFRISDPIRRPVYSALNDFAQMRCEKQYLQARMEPLKLLMLLPYAWTHQCGEGFMTSYYTLQDTWTINPSTHSLDPLQALSTPPDGLPKWASDLDICLPVDKTGGRPVAEIYNVWWHISQDQARQWTSALRDIQWKEIDVRNPKFSRLFRKLDDLKSRLDNTSSRTKARYPYLSELESVVGIAQQRWKTVMNEQLPSVHWAIQPHMMPFVHSLLYISKHDDIRSREDAYSMFDDDEQIRVSKSGILWKYVEMFNRDQSRIV